MRPAELGETDEFTVRRVIKAVDAQYLELLAGNPERVAAIDRELTMIDLRRRALQAGRAAYAAGDFALAELHLVLSFDRTVGDSSVYLTALYRHTNDPAMAQAWWTIAQTEGFDQDDLDAVLGIVPANPPS